MFRESPLVYLQPKMSQRGIQCLRVSYLEFQKPCTTQKACVLVVYYGTSFVLIPTLVWWDLRMWRCCLNFFPQMRRIFWDLPLGSKSSLRIHFLCIWQLVLWTGWLHWEISARWGDRESNNRILCGFQIVPKYVEIADLGHDSEIDKSREQSTAMYLQVSTRMNQGCQEWRGRSQQAWHGKSDLLLLSWRVRCSPT